MTTTIWWIRRDLRLGDNQALHMARSLGDQVIPLYILDPALLHSPYVGEKRLAFLFAGLRQLRQDLQARGSDLLIQTGAPQQALAALLAETGAAAICAEADYSPYARSRDDAIAARLPLHLTAGLTVHPPDLITKGDGQPYTVYTPFSRAWKERVGAMPAGREAGQQRDGLPAGIAPTLPAPATLPTPPLPEGARPAGEPALPADALFLPGEAEAQRRLQAFGAGPDAAITRYDEGRNRLDLEGTSQLSPYLRFGMISARQAMVAAQEAWAAARTPQARQGAETWLNELIWREFFIAILYHFPHVRQGPLRPNWRPIPWRNDEAEFAAWQQGRTGYPVVDAAMRQLLHSGWMHNRARMIVASFLVKDLLIDWRWGERWFMQHLIDGDPAANNGGWQWSAGSGADAAPYFRIFNPTSQASKHDPDGDYIRRWLPELARVPIAYLYQPWTMPAAIQQQSGCILGVDYPRPIVDHAAARARALQTYGLAGG
ncbi:MAG: deoxyribodipyrimidine photo-lyase [Caldilineales bacterium]|nr:deoxyribodipyrimidine photo-lyase [Caldilineales bacterium]